MRNRFSRATDNVDSDIPRLANDLVHRRLAEQASASSRLRAADDDLGYVLLPGVSDHRFSHHGTLDGFDPGSQPFGETQSTIKLFLLGGGKTLIVRSLDIDCDPIGIELHRQPPGASDQAIAGKARTEADHHQFTGGLLAAAVGFKCLGLFIHPVGNYPQCKLSQGQEIALAEKTLGSQSCLFREIDLALLEALQQFIGRQVHQFDLIGLIDQGIRYGLPHPDAGNLSNVVAQAFDVLHV